MNSSVEEKKSNGDVVIDINDDAGRSRNIETSNAGRLCRICQETKEIAPLFKLGCACKGGLGFLHQNCATTWFSLKGDTYVFVSLF